MFKVGDKVRLSGQDVVGQIVEIEGKKAVVLFGQLKSTVSVSKLEPVSSSQLKNIEKQKTSILSSARSEIRDKQLSFNQEIDVRGMRVDEALQAVIYFIDDAQMIGIRAIRRLASVKDRISSAFIP